jgi:DNA repair protein RAD50
MKAFEKELATETASAKIKRETIESKASIARDLDDNIAYLKGKEEEAKLTSEINALRAKIQALGVDVNAVELTFRADQKSRDELREAYAESQGRVTTHQEAIDACKKELNDPQYKGVRKRLSKHVVELKTYEYVSQDLERYHSALDRALMAFHASKMSDINKVVKELWQRTYRGQDIDFIQIRSDDDTGNKGRSSYNYRVVMIVGDAELEMRGRCSAGQKVLACLIIRLALAETFCLNCGILALDEPTTNLDAPNADALARSLIDIMRSREDQENFQLIVITHDMHFAQVLGQREHADYYWRITKDDDQHSHIECENIYE